VPNILTRTLRAATRELGGTLNVLVLGSTHERYESMLALTGHNFFMLGASGLKSWDDTYAPLPQNYTQLNGALGDKQVPKDVCIDLVMSQTRHLQFDLARQYAETYQIPHVHLEHVLPSPKWRPATLKEKQGRTGNVNVFISDYSREAWGCPGGLVIEHGIDLDVFRPNPGYRVNRVLAVVNDWKNRDTECGYTFWKEATEGLPVRIVGKTPGLSEPAASVDALAWEYQSSLIFANTARVSPIPTVMLEAMACGCAVVTTRNPMVESIIKDGVNGILCDSPSDMRAAITRLLDDPSRAMLMGIHARVTIEHRFSLWRFLADWTRALEDAAEMTLKGSNG
jgi:glycosyltransferase involved in cell wall biosynthesis